MLAAYLRSSGSLILSDVLTVGSAFSVRFLVLWVVGLSLAGICGVLAFVSAGGGAFTICVFLVLELSGARFVRVFSRSFLHDVPAIVNWCFSSGLLRTRATATVTALRLFFSCMLS